MQNAFALSSSSWWLLAGLCVALPLLIHLIQLFRHQKIRWAAMAFLLRSQKRNRRWIRLKQWLLIVTRMSLLLLGLMTFSQVRCDQAGFDDYFGSGGLTHHLVLMDDSFSMEEAVAGGSAKSRATQAIGQLLGQLETQTNQRISLITFSHAKAWQDQLLLRKRVREVADGSNHQKENENEEAFAVVHDEVVTKDLATQLITALESTPPSFVASEPTAAVEWALSQSNDPEVGYVVHVLSDFRQKQWDKENTFWKKLKASDIASQWNFVDCAEDQSSSVLNLGIVELQSIGNLNTTKTGFQMEVGVRNFGSVDAKNTVVSIDVWHNRRDARRLLAVDANVESDDSADWQRVELPAVLFEEIPAGQTVRQTFPVSFSEPGLPVIRATLPDDALAADNSRQVSVAARAQWPLLVIDDSLSQGSWYLEQSLNPAGMTGLECKIDSSSTLRRMSREELQPFKLIALVDLPRLDEETTAKLKSYVAAGGGLIWFVGPKAQPQFYNQDLYSSGLFPIQLERVIKTPERIAGDAADLQVTEHPIFVPFLLGDQSQLDAIVFQWIWKVDLLSFPNSTVGDSGSTNSRLANAKVLARFRGKQDWPLFLEHQLRVESESTKEFDNSNAENSNQSPVSGKIVTILNTCDGQWNNWPQELTFPAMVMLLSDYVARPDSSRQFTVGDSPGLMQLGTMPTTVTATQLFDSQAIQRVSSIEPSSLATQSNSSEVLLVMLEQLQQAVAQDAIGEQVNQNKENRVHSERLVGLMPTVLDFVCDSDGSNRWQRWVANVDQGESNLERSHREALGELNPETTNYVHWNQLLWESDSVANQAWLRPMILGLLLLLVTEAGLALWTGGGANG